MLAQVPEGTPLSALPYTPSLDVPSMDRTIDPCQDFYHYACGSWIKANPIPPDQAAWNVYAKLGNENQRFLWGILEQAAKPSPERTVPEQKIGDFFAACMDESAVNGAGSKPLKNHLDRIAGIKSLKQLAAVIATEQHHADGSGFLFGFGSNQDFKNSDRMIAFAGAGGLSLPDRDYYTKTDAKSVETRQKFLAHVQRMFELLGESPGMASANARAVMHIETELAKASLTRVEKRDPYKLYHPLSRTELQALTPSFDWDSYLATSNVPSIASLNVTEPEFFKTVESQLRSNGLEKWKTYLRWHLVHANAPYLSAPFVQANFDFYSKYLRGVPQMQPRWKRCVHLVDRDLGEALGQVFVQKTFGPEVKQRTLDMTKQIEAAMESEISQLPWMGEQTKQQALAKLHAIVNKIGFPDKWRDYSSVLIDRQEFLANVMRAIGFETRRDLAKIGMPVDRGEWDMTPPTVNAYFNSQMNDINFPAGVLQPPLFDSKMDDAPNYGNTGATIGHELTHGFDDEGRQFDAKGNLRDWWTKQDAEAFEKRAQCVSDQYAQYTVVDNIKVNSKLTLGEDVADLGGTLLAYIAWKHATMGQKLTAIDGLSPDQRFFIGMAQWACGNERDENKRVNAITNPHSPDQYRINGVVANLPEFAQAFACKVGEPMVRENACRIW